MMPGGQGQQPMGLQGPPGGLQGMLGQPIPGQQGMPSPGNPFFQVFVELGSKNGGGVY